MCLRAQGIDNDGGGVVIVRRPHRLSNDGGGVVRGREIDDTYKGSKTTAELAGARRRSQGIYDGDKGVDGRR